MNVVQDEARQYRISRKENRVLCIGVKLCVPEMITHSKEPFSVDKRRETDQRMRTREGISSGKCLKLPRVSVLRRRPLAFISPKNSSALQIYSGRKAVMDKGRGLRRNLASARKIHPVTRSSSDSLK